MLKFNQGKVFYMTLSLFSLYCIRLLSQAMEKPTFLLAFYFKLTKVNKTHTQISLYRVVECDTYIF